MNPAHNAIFQWIEANDYHRSEPGRELTLTYEPDGDETKSIREIQFSPSPWRVPTQSRPFHLMKFDDQNRQSRNRGFSR